MQKNWEGGTRVSKTKDRKEAEGSKLASRGGLIGQEEEHESPEGRGQDKERSEGPGLCNSLKKAEETGHLSSGRTKNSEYIRREGSKMWVAKLCGSTGKGVGRGPAGCRAPRAGLLTCLGCSGAESAVATAYKERGRSSAERGRMVWQGWLGGSGWPGQAGGQEVPGGHCPPGPLLGVGREEGSGWTWAWLAPYLSGS